MNKFDVEDLADIRDYLKQNIIDSVKWHTLKGRRNMSLVWEALDMVVRWKQKQEAKDDKQSDSLPSKISCPPAKE